MNINMTEIRNLNGTIWFSALNTVEKYNPQHFHVIYLTSAEIRQNIKSFHLLNFLTYFNDIFHSVGGTTGIKFIDHKIVDSWLWYMPNTVGVHHQLYESTYQDIFEALESEHVHPASPNKWIMVFLGPILKVLRQCLIRDQGTVFVHLWFMVRWSVALTRASLT